MKRFIAGACLLAAGLLAAPARPARGAQAPPSQVRIYTATDIAGVLDRLERQADRFDDAFADALDRSVLKDTDQASRLNDQADKLEDEIGKLKSAYKDGKDERKVRERLDRVLATASDINLVMLERRFVDDVQQKWSEIRAELNGLALAYSLTPLKTL